MSAPVDLSKKVVDPKAPQALVAQVPPLALDKPPKPEQDGKPDEQKLPSLE
jgi:hypothetical protein